MHPHLSCREGILLGHQDNTALFYIFIMYTVQYSGIYSTEYLRILVSLLAAQLGSNPQSRNNYALLEGAYIQHLFRIFIGYNVPNIGIYRQFDQQFNIDGIVL